MVINRFFLFITFTIQSNMIIPVRCFTCGKVVGNKWKPYVSYCSEGIWSQDEILDKLGLRRVCCRSMIITHVDLIGKLNRQHYIETEESKVYTTERPHLPQRVDLEEETTAMQV